MARKVNLSRALGRTTVKGNYSAGKSSKSAPKVKRAARTKSARGANPKNY